MEGHQLDGGAGRVVEMQLAGHLQRLAHQADLAGVQR